ncbi:InlB B-repeat-containing protein, partial [[Ruminococcus] lactaris]|uniref:InlB B-repeat-containing protein n=1 Tax=[Ruminococcus] lactaris TaxID=46228 RepID=UPI003AB3D585
MKKRILSILLLCCMVLTMLPTTAFAAGELPDVKLSVPTTFDKTVDLTKQNKELKIKDSKTYLIKGSADPNWYFQYRIKIDGKNNTPHIFLDGVRLQAPKDGPAIELYGGASACLYFIGGDSELIGAENFAALQKNKTDGYLRVLVRTGTKLTCKGGTYGAGIGGSKVGIKKFSQGHGVNLHFGSLATDIYSGEISATSGPFAAGIGGGANGGVGEQIYVYSGKLTATSVSQGAGIGGGQGGPGRFIYIRGGTVVSSSRSAGAGIGSGDQDGLNEREDAHHIEISGGAVLAFSNYAGAGIGGGRDGSGCDISITGGVVQAQGYFGAGIGGGMNGDSWNILIKDTTLTALAFPLYPSSDYTELSASAVGRGSNRTHYMSAMKNQEDLLYEENIKIGASDGKSVRLSATGWQWHRSQGPYEMDWGTTTELLIPNENGRVDLQRLSLPYAYNYGRVISKLELRCMESTCSHEFGWANRDGCHIWACKNCGARDPAAEMSKQNGKHIPGDWSNQEQFCTVCGHVLERDTKAPVMETLTDGESYTVEDTLDGKPGAYTFTVSDPAASGETSSGVKSVTINGVPQDGPTYRLPAPDGGNNDAGAEYTVVATDNAGNETTATVRTYRRHHEHSYSDWSKDGTSHWHECTDYDCPNRNKSIKDKAAHDYTDDADTICNVCGYERTVTPPAPAEYTITVTSGGNGTASTSHAKAVAGTEITLTATPNTGYHFKEWEVMSGGVTIKDDKFLMPGSNVEVKAIFEDMSKEQFTLAPGGTYYFDLSGESIPGTANDALPDSTMHYVPFTYAGTVDAYKLTSEMATTEEYAQKNEYVHSLFVADYAVTHKASWNTLNNASLIFGKGYAAGGVDYTLRTPSVGSDGTGSGNSQRCTPQSNEWDRILDKNSGYIKNWSAIYSWGQDTASNTKEGRALRGYGSARYWNSYNAMTSHSGLGFRPVLEVLNPDTMGSDRLKVVTLDLGGGKLGGSSEDIQIIVKNGGSFTAPASNGLTRPDGNTGSYFMWLGSDGKLYEPGDNVSADVTRLTAQFDEQFTLTIGDTYWFDLSGVGIPGTANGSLPDASLHYVPFTYAGTVDAYKLASAMATTEEYAQQNKYAHSLFVADYVVTHTVGWDNLDDASLIFGKNYATGGISYTLRAPSTGSDGTGSGNSRRGTPQSNEWDRILDKDDGYIKNCGEVHSWGQDTDSSLLVNRARRGYNSARNWSDWNATWSRSGIGFRPVLEVLNPKTLGADGLKAITLDLGGGKLGNSSEDIQIIVKNGES